MKYLLFFLHALSVTAFTPLNSIYKVFSKFTGTKWPETTTISSELLENFDKLQNMTIQYPDYYKKPFHSYKKGNLNFEAGLEIESMYETAWQFLHANKNIKIKRTAEDFYYIRAYNSFNEPINILDIGCSTGISTTLLSEQFPHTLITGLDLSPYFLAIAEQKNTNNNITYIHHNAEKLPFNDNEFDIIHLGYILHELPLYAINNVLTEANRVVKNGGVIAVSDLDISFPKNIITQIFLKLGEPHIEDYYKYMNDILLVLYYLNLTDYKLYYQSNNLIKWCVKKELLKN